MPKDDLVYVGHMLDVATLALSTASCVTREGADAAENLRLALAHLIQTLGEAARQVSIPFRDAHPEIPWAKIIGMRHRVVHDDLHVDYDVAWGVATCDPDGLIRLLGDIVPPRPA